MAIKGIIFDFWGTLVENGVFPSPVSQVKYFLRLRDMRFQDYIVRFEKVFMTKKFENLTDCFDAVCKEFNVNPPDWVIEKMIGMWNKNRLLAKPFPETIEILEKLRKDYKIGLISNTDCFSVDPLIEKFNMGPHFNSVIMSYKEGMLKSDKGLFEKCLKEMKLKNNEVIMVGDSIESDIKSAENAGIKAILIDRRNKREFENKITSLSQVPEMITKI